MAPEGQLPERIGRYPVVSHLGRGAMGSVYLARDTELERDVAIKTVRMPSAATAEEQESFLVRFRNEARAVGRLRHACIIAVYDVGNDPEHGPYLVFEYVEGSNLKDILRTKGPLTPEQVVALAEQVGGALDAAHREGIIHRDIKPENLLVGRDGMVRLADFGVARVPDAALTGEGQFLGTPCYGAPETLQSGSSGPLSDQFSLAAVLYEAACGTRAFPGNDAVAVAHRVIHEDPPPPSTVAVQGAIVPNALDHVILRGLAKDPEQRYPRLAQLVSELRYAYGLGAAPNGVADTLPAPGAGRVSRRPSLPLVPEKKKLPLWPFFAFVGLGVMAAAQLAGRVPAADESETPASIAPPIIPRVEMVKARPSESKRDAAEREGPADAGQAARKDPADAASSEPLPRSQLSAFEREERAKDALERAERALRSGDKEAAKAALDEAQSYDPEHPDIAALRRKL